MNDLIRKNPLDVEAPEFPAEKPIIFPGVNGCAICDCGCTTFRVGIEAVAGNNDIRCLECTHCSHKLSVPFFDDGSRATFRALAARLEAAGSIWLVEAGEDRPLAETDCERLTDIDRDKIIATLKAQQARAHRERI